MIVAAAAIDGQSQECLTDRSDHLFQFVLLRKLLHSLATTNHGVVDTGDEKPRSRGAFSTGLQQVTHELHADEFVVRHVAIEGFDHPVTVVPEVVSWTVSFEPVAFPEAHNVEPVSSPALAVTRRLEQAVDNLRVLFVGRIANECRNDIGTRRQTDQVEVHASNQRSRISRRRRLQTSQTKTPPHEFINGIARPSRVANLRRPRQLKRLQRPPVVSGPTIGRVAESVYRIRTPLRTGLDPQFER